MEKFSHVHAGHRKRLRENILKSGLENKHEHQVLEYVLSFVIPRKDTNVIAHNLIKKFGSFKNVLHSSPKELQEISGIGEVVAVYLNTLKDVINYYNKSTPQTTTKVLNSYDVAEYFKPFFSNIKQEEFYVACINNKNEIIHYEKLALGSDNNVIIKIKDIMNILNKNLCTTFIVSHNHPEGNCHPSANDISFTKNLYISAHLAGFNLLDHIIIGSKDFYSFRDYGLFLDFDKLINKIALS